MKLMFASPQGVHFLRLSYRALDKSQSGMGRWGDANDRVASAE